MLFQTLLHCFFPLMMLFEALPNLVAFNPGTKEICVWSSWQQKVNSGARVRGQQQLGWRHRAEAVPGIHYISFRSSRVWSSILCVQRCSSLVDFSLSGREQESRVINQHQATAIPLPKKACASPCPTRCRSDPWTGVPGWVQLEALRLPGLCVALASHTAGAPSHYGHGAPLAKALGSVSHAGISDCSQLLPGLPHLHS